MARRNVVAALDVGTSKVVALIGETDGYGQIDVIGLGEAPSAGLRKGMIVDIERTARSVAEALAAAERMSGVPVQDFYVSIGGPHIYSLPNRGVIAVANPDREITPEDVHRVIQAAQVIHLPSDRHILHVLPRQFIVDGLDGVIDPTGMAGSRLEVEAVIVTAAATAVKNLQRSLQRAGIQTAEMVVGSLAAAEATLSAAEKDLGTMLVDIGGGTSEIALFDQGGLCFVSVVPLGGGYITSDLAIGLRLPLAEAEAVKKEHTFLPMDQASDSLYITLPGSREQQQVSQRFISGVAQPRLEEIMQYVKQEVDKMAGDRLLPGGVVLTGGTAEIKGITELAGRVLQMPVRVGYPQGVGGMDDIVSLPAYATAVGVLIYAATGQARNQAAATRERGGAGFWPRLWAWFLDFFREE